jgi:F0F1-type ATP synthase assembly protein I
MVHPDPQQPKAGNSQKSNGDRDLWHYLGLGTQLTVTVGLFALLGWWLDKKFGWTPWGMVGSASLGVAVGMYGFLKEALR